MAAFFTRIVVLIVSRCHKYPVSLSETESEAFYVCGKCHRNCGTIFSLDLSLEDATHDEQRTANKIEEIFDFA